MFESQLGEIFDFTAEDLAANQAGLLSKRQSLRLQKRQQWLFIALVLIPVLAGASAYLFFDNGITTVGVLVFLLLILFAFLHWYGLLSFGQERKLELLKGKVAAVQGDLLLNEQKSVNPRGTFYFYALYVGNLRFTISEKQFALLSDLEAGVYIVYYTPTSKVILSMEMA